MTIFIRFPLFMTVILILVACQGCAPTTTPVSLPTFTSVSTATSLPALRPDSHTDPSNPHDYDTYPSIPALGELPMMQNAAGFESQFAITDQFLLFLLDVPPAPQGQAYQGWLISEDGAYLAVGAQSLTADGSLRLEWTSPTGENLLARFTGFQITLESADGSDAPTGPAVYRGQMDAQQAARAHLLFVTNNSELVTPLNVPFIPGLLTQLEIAIQHIQNAQNAEAIGAAQEMRVHLEHVINIIEGADGERFSDYDGDGSAQNPGDGFGVKEYAHAVAAVLETPDLAVPIIGAADALQDQAVAIITLQDMIQAAVLLTALHQAAEALRDGPASALYQQADKVAWFSVSPLP